MLLLSTSVTASLPSDVSLLRQSIGRGAAFLKMTLFAGLRLSMGVAQ